MQQWGGLTDSEFTIGGVHFVVQKLPPEPAYDLLESILYELRTPAQIAGADSSVGGLVSAVLSLTPEFKRRVRDTLFRHITFQGNGAVTPQPLIGQAGTAIDLAFGGLPVVAIHEVMGRALAVNFHESWAYLDSRLDLGNWTSRLSSLAAPGDSGGGSGLWSPPESSPMTGV